MKSYYTFAGKVRGYVPAKEKFRDTALTALLGPENDNTSIENIIKEFIINNFGVMKKKDFDKNEKSIGREVEIIVNVKNV